MAIIESALSALAVLADRKNVYHDLSRTIADVQDTGFHFDMPAADGQIEGAFVSILDEILGDKLATYFLYECPSMKAGGAITESDGTRYPIRTIDDLRKYIEARP